MTLQKTSKWRLIFSVEHSFHYPRLIKDSIISKNPKFVGVHRLIMKSESD
jgi:hypothetical protein